FSPSSPLLLLLLRKRRRRKSKSAFRQHRLPFSIRISRYMKLSRDLAPASPITSTTRSLLRLRSISFVRSQAPLSLLTATPSRLNLERNSASASTRSAFLQKYGLDYSVSTRFFPFNRTASSRSEGITSRLMPGLLWNSIRPSDRY